MKFILMLQCFHVCLASGGGEVLVIGMAGVLRMMVSSDCVVK